MTIRPGETWGELVEAPPGLVWVADDAALAAHLDRPGGAPVAVAGGDLLRTLGGRSSDGRLRRFPIDVLRVAIEDGAPFLAAAHVVARQPGRFGWWRGPLWAACNVSHVGRWDVAPRSHPNDGRLDVVEVDAAMTLRDRRQAAQRLPTGSHVPHPAIHMTRPMAATWDPGHRFVVFVDGVDRGRADRVTVTLEPDAAVVHA